MSLTRTTRFQKLYGALSENEKSEFREFLNLSYLSVSRIPKKVLENLKENPNFLDYLRKNYSERTVWNTLSELSKLIVKYLESKKLLSGKSAVESSKLISESNGRTQTHFMHFKKELERAHNTKYYHGLFEDVFTKSHYHYELLAKSHNLEVLREADRMLTNFYTAKVLLEILIFLKAMNFKKHIRKLIQNSVPTRIFSKIDFAIAIEIVKDTTPELYPIVKMCYMLYNLSMDPVDISALRDIHSHLVQNSGAFSDLFKSEVYYTILNCYIMINNEGRIEVKHEIFSLIKEKLQAGIIDDLQNDENHFRDYVIIAISLDEVDWASDFVKQYSHLLPESVRENEANICSASIEFKKEYFSEALRHLARIKRHDSMHIIDYYSMYIKCHFELGNSEECTLALRRFSESLKHVKQIPENYIKLSLNFVNVMSKLLKYSAEKTGKRLLDLEVHIINSPTLFNRKWLLQKITQINSTR